MTNIEGLRHDAEVYIEQTRVARSARTTPESNQTQNKTVETPPDRPQPVKMGFILNSRLRLMGIQHREQVLELANLLQEFQNVSQRYPTAYVVASEAESRAKTYQDNGYEVEIVGVQGDDNQKALRLNRNVPYRFGANDARGLSQIIEEVVEAGKPPDLAVQICRDLHDVGLWLGAIWHRTGGIETAPFISAISQSPETVSFLHKLAELGIRIDPGGYSSGGVRDLDVIKLTELAQQYPDIGQLGTDPQKVVLVNEAAGRIKLEELPDFLAITQDEQSAEVLFQIRNKLRETSDLYGFPLLKYVRALRESPDNLDDQLLKLFELNITTPSLSVRSVDGIAEAIENLRQYIISDNVRALLGDAGLIDSVSDVSDLLGTKIDPNELTRYQTVCQSKNGLALLGLLRDWHADQTGYDGSSGVSNVWKYNFDIIELLLRDENESLLAEIIKPEFQSFVDGLAASGYRFDLRKLVNQYSENKHGSLFELYENVEAREFISSPEGAEILQLSGGLDLDRLKFDMEFEKLPNGLKFLRDLKEFYGLRIRDLNSWGFSGMPSEIVELVSSEEMRSTLFSQEAVDLYKRMADAEGFRFRLSYYFIREFTDLVRNPELQKKIFDESNAGFIKESCGVTDVHSSLSVRHMEILADVPEELRPLIHELISKFGYSVSFHSTDNKIIDQELLEALDQNDDLKARLFDQNPTNADRPDSDRVSFVRKIINNPNIDYYRFNISDIETLISLPIGIIDFVDEISRPEFRQTRVDASRRLKLDDLTGLVVLQEHREKYLEMLGQLVSTGMKYDYSPRYNDALIRLFELPLDKIFGYYSYFLNKFGRNQSFDPSEALGLSILIEKNYTTEMLDDVVTVCERVTGSESKWWSISSVPDLIYLYEHQDEVVETVRALEQLGSPPQGDQIHLFLISEIRQLHAEGGVERIRAVKADFPDFVYQFGTVTDPYIKIVWSDESRKKFFEHFRSVVEISRPYTDGLLGSILTQSGISREETTVIVAEKGEEFSQTVQQLREGVFSSEETQAERRAFFCDIRVLQFVTTEPAKLKDLVELSNLGLLDNPRSFPYLLANLNKIFEHEGDGRIDFLTVVNQVADHLYGSDQYQNLQGITDKILTLGPAKREQYLGVLDGVTKSPSREIQRIRSELIDQLMTTEDPIATYNKIEQIFIRNNIPLVGKTFEVFQIIHQNGLLAEKLADPKLSPVLRRASEARRYSIIYGDLLRAQLLSGNRNLRDFMTALQGDELHLDELESADFQTTDPDELIRARHFIDRLRALHEESLIRVSRPLSSVPSTAKDRLTPEKIREELTDLRQSLAVREDQTIHDRIAEMFLRPLGVDSVDAAMEMMRGAKARADGRARSLVAGSDGSLTIESGTLLKGIGQEFFGRILQNGSVAKEFLGESAASDMTPLDTDVSRVTNADAAAGFSDAVHLSIASSYGDLMLVVKDRGQFQQTSSETPARVDPEHYELFETGGGRHFGIRTGFPMTEVDFIVARPDMVADTRSLEAVYFEIAQNGYYIPVVNDNGEIVFTPEMYDDYRRIFAGLSNFDGVPVDILRMAESDPQFQSVHELAQEIDADRKNLDRTYSTIRETIVKVLKSFDPQINLKEPHDAGILGAELLDTGSTGRHTNKPGDYDFDLALRLDDADMPKMMEIVTRIMQALKSEDDSLSHPELERGYYQIRAMKSHGIIEGETFDIDIGISGKSEQSVFGSHDSIREKLDSISTDSGSEAQTEVIANIVLAKKMLSEIGAYKKLDGGWGGIGTENWILAHGGNIVEAFRSFWEASHDNNGNVIDIGKFREHYKIVDAGTNIKKSGHDNYTENLSEGGYQKMLQAIGQYLTEHHLIEEPQPAEQTPQPVIA
ncbi:MAG: hypothetical protein Q7S80_01840 [bacterium]|nr:hypothetical protein [bacterium]